MEKKMTDPIDLTLKTIKFFKNKAEFYIAEKKIEDFLKKSKEENNRSYRTLKAIVKESDLSREQTEFVLNNSKKFRQSVKRGQDDLWTLKKFD